MLDPKAPASVWHVGCIGLQILPCKGEGKRSQKQCKKKKQHEKHNGNLLHPMRQSNQDSQVSLEEGLAAIGYHHRHHLIIDVLPAPMLVSKSRWPQVEHRHQWPPLQCLQQESWARPPLLVTWTSGILSSLWQAKSAWTSYWFYCLLGAVGRYRESKCLASSYHLLHETYPSGLAAVWPVSTTVSTAVGAKAQLLPQFLEAREVCTANTGDAKKNLKPSGSMKPSGIWKNETWWVAGCWDS